MRVMGRAFVVAVLGLCLVSCDTQAAAVAWATAAPLLTEGTVEFMVLSTPDPTATPSPLQQVYRVKQGDTLAAIGAWFAVSPADLAAANSLADPNRITPGDMLIIPEVETPWIPAAALVSTQGPTATATTNPVPAGVGCIFYHNYTDRPFTLTYTRQDDGWNRTHKVSAGAQRQRYCLAPGRYTITASTPGVESVNTECVMVAGERRDWPLYLRQP